MGKKEFDNGVVILVSTGGGQGNRKVAIATGYGAEGAVPDVTAKTIIDNSIIPDFKEHNSYRGLDKGTDDIINALAGRYKATKGSQSKGKGIGIGAIFLILLLIFLSAAGRGGRGGGMASRRGYRDLGAGWILGSLLGGAGRGGDGGGGWSGGGGGGFGGFGGGSFGGGGASGSW